MTQTQDTKATLTIEEKRKRRHELRKARRKDLAEKFKDLEFKKTYHTAKKTRANARVAAFKKAKSGKK